MRLDIVGAAVAAFTLATSGTGFADSPKEALREIGLVGTYSPDCSRDLSRGAPGWFTYSAPVFGEPTTVTVTPYYTIHYLVESAQRATATKIILRLKITHIENTANVKLSMKEGDQYETVIERLGDKMKLQQSTVVGGPVLVKDGTLTQGPMSPTPLLEKCINK